MPPKTRKGGRARGRGHNSVEGENEVTEDNDKDVEQSQEVEETDEQEGGSKHSSKENEVYSILKLKHNWLILG